jgi:hypothetical protein
MDASRRAEHCGVVYLGTILFFRLAVRAMRPGLIYLARRPQSAETRPLHPQRPENDLPHQLFPGLAADLFSDRARQHVTEVRVFVLRTRFGVELNRCDLFDDGGALFTDRPSSRRFSAAVLTIQIRGRLDPVASRSAACARVVIACRTRAASFRSQRFHRIDFRGPPRRNPARQQGDERQQ